MKSSEEKVRIDGPAGALELIVDDPGELRGIALVCHPHPLFGGTQNNKVTYTLARTFAHLGYLAIRPNFRGVGASAGAHDDGHGECDDMLEVLADARQRYGDLPIALAGFSFGAYVQTRVAAAMVAAQHPAQRLVLVGMATGRIEDEGEGDRQYAAPTVPGDSIVIHGAADTTVPLANVLAWAEPQQLPIIVVPGADHFFHRRLNVIRDIVTRAWRY
ncbi:MAG: alpha/beta fold hydrolase [Propionivibrio sp.]